MECFSGRSNWARSAFLDGCRPTDSVCRSEALEPEKCVSDHFIYAHVLELHILISPKPRSRRTHPSFDLAEALACKPVAQIEISVVCFIVYPTLLIPVIRTLSRPRELFDSINTLLSTSTRLPLARTVLQLYFALASLFPDEIEIKIEIR